MTTMIIFSYSYLHNSNSEVELHVTVLYHANLSVQANYYSSVMKI